MNSERTTYPNGKIMIDPYICNGKPTIRGKRITVQTIIEFLSAGDSTKEILNEYPSLEEEDIRSCLIFASELMNHKYTLQKIAYHMDSDKGTAPTKRSKRSGTSA